VDELGPAENKKLSDQIGFLKYEDDMCLKRRDEDSSNSLLTVKGYGKKVIKANINARPNIFMPEVKFGTGILFMSYAHPENSKDSDLTVKGEIDDSLISFTSYLHMSVQGGGEPTELTQRVSVEVRFVVLKEEKN